MRQAPNFLLALLLLAPGLPGRADTGVADLGQNLAYLRPTDAKADLPVFAARAAAGALIVDLRRTAFAAADDKAWLAAFYGQPAGKKVILVLISPATAPELLTAFAGGLPGCITIGRAEGSCHPDMNVATDAVADARACDALANGTPPAALAVETIDKPRHDEVELGRLHAAGKSPGEDSGPEIPPATPANPPPNRVVQVDAVLQRAVAIERGLVALGKVDGPPQAPSTTSR